MLNTCSKHKKNIILNSQLVVQMDSNHLCQWYHLCLCSH